MKTNTQMQQEELDRLRGIHKGDHYGDACGPNCPALGTPDEMTCTADWPADIDYDVDENGN